MWLSSKLKLIQVSLMMWPGGPTITQRQSIPWGYCWGCKIGSKSAALLFHFAGRRRYDREAIFWDFYTCGRQLIIPTICCISYLLLSYTSYISYTCRGELITPTISLKIPPLPLHTFMNKPLLNKHLKFTEVTAIDNHEDTNSKTLNVCQMAYYAIVR